jgi:hypothetical protein
LPVGGERGPRLVEPGPVSRRYREERRRLRRWLTALRREIGRLERLSTKAASENHTRDLKARIRELRADENTLIKRLSWLRRRLLRTKP